MQIEETTSKTWTRTLDPDPEKAGPGKPEKTWTLKSLDTEKHGINMGLKIISDFIDLCFIKTMRNVTKTFIRNAFTLDILKFIQIEVKF